MPCFNVGDRVEVVGRQDSSPIGIHGTVSYISTSNLPYCVRIDDADIFIRCHDGVNEDGRSDENRVYYYYSAHNLALVTPSHRRASARTHTCHCSNCGAIVPIDRAIRSSKGKYVCNSCMSVKGYSTRNNKVIGKPSKSHKTYGFEFECIPRSRNHEACLINDRFNFIPTSDGSLPSNGVELKSPTINGGRSLYAMFKEAEEHVRFDDERCGQHINMGDTEYLNADSMRSIREYARFIFLPLERYMKTHTDSTIRICGRNFVHYASPSEGRNFCHGVWVNLDHDNRIEWRLSKFVNAEQYYVLCSMWTDMLDTIINKFLKRANGDIANDGVCAIKTGVALVEVFKRYESGISSIQKRMASRVAA